MLFNARRDVGNLYYDRRHYSDAVKHLRDALLEGDLLSNHEEKRSEIHDLVQTIYNAYNPSEISDTGTQIGNDPPRGRSARAVSAKHSFPPELVSLTDGMPNNRHRFSFACPLWPP